MSIAFETRLFLVSRLGFTVLHGVSPPVEGICEASLLDVGLVLFQSCWMSFVFKISHAKYVHNLPYFVWGRVSK